jgi:hypothetical protein
MNATIAKRVGYKWFFQCPECGGHHCCVAEPECYECAFCGAEFLVDYQGDIIAGMRNGILMTLILGAFAAIVVALLTGCVTLATDYRKVGFREMQRGFDALARKPDLHEVVKLDNVTVHIVGDRSRFQWQQARQEDSRIAGYATRRNDIWTFGAVVDGRIVVNQAILGHELNHLLQFATENRPTPIHDPDRLDDIGA